MEFVKMNGAGNDYIFVDLTKEKLKNPNELSVVLSNRNYSIGADGLVLIDKSLNADCKMRIFNKDGSEAQMCGNAIRCVAKYVYENWQLNKEILNIETLSGIKELWLNIADGKVKSVTVDMGIPNAKSGILKQVFDKTISLVEVNVGNPHAVMFTNKLDDATMGILREISTSYPDGINAEAANVVSKSVIDMRVYERGSGETLACGTGASAVMYAAFINGLVYDNVSVRLTGGTLRIYYKDGHLFMEGDAKINYKGDVNING